MSFRRRSREIALQVLFQKEFNPQSRIESALELFSENFDMEDRVKEFAEFLVQGVSKNQKEIDNLIQTFCHNWKLSRMPLVDKNILRLATFELIYTPAEVPTEVTINEAIEISKRYSNADSSGFINGVLDNISKSRQR